MTELCQRCGAEHELHSSVEVLRQIVPTPSYIEWALELDTDAGRVVHDGVADNARAIEALCMLGARFVAAQVASGWTLVPASLVSIDPRASAVASHALAVREGRTCTAARLLEWLADPT